MPYKFYKNNLHDTIRWVENEDQIGVILFSFDKKRVFNLFRDYPHELTEDQRYIFKKKPL